MYHRILVPIDSSETRQDLLETTARLAALSDAEVTVFHAVSADHPETDDLLAEALSYLARSSVLASGHSVVRGRRSVASAIVQAADETNADLIVMGSGSHSGLHALFSGSVSHGVLVQTSRPVMLVASRHASEATGQSTERPALDLRRILVAVESEAEIEPLCAAVEGVCEQCQVILLHISEVYATAAPMASMVYVEPRQEGKRVLIDAVRSLRRDGFKAEMRLVAAPGEEVGRLIARTAEECSADLIVLTSHREGGLRGLLVPSTARAVIAHARIPVLIAELVPRPVKREPAAQHA